MAFLLPYLLDRVLLGYKLALANWLAMVKTAEIDEKFLVSERNCVAT
jgi:hypothetical protein